MRNPLLSALLIATVVGTLAAKEPTRVVWVYLRDKGIVAEWEPKARDTLSPRALARRAKVRGRRALVDRKDLPLYDQYVKTIESTVTRLRHTSKWFNAVSAEVTEAQERLLLKLPYVRDVTPINAFRRVIPPTLEPLLREETSTEDLDYGDSYNQLAQIRVPHLHRLGYTGSDVLVCMLDTGFFKDHESLNTLDVRAERDFVFNDMDTQRDPANPEDFSDSHGTSAWSALGGNAPGRLVGPAYGASFLLAKTEDLRYELPVEEDHWVAAVEWAEAEGADVISSSLAYTLFQDGSGYSFEELDGNTAVTTVAADRAAALGVAVVVAAGNYRTTSWGHIGTPADGDSVISVGAVDANGDLASFSSPGPTADGRIKPEVCARGVNTYAASNSAIWAYGSSSGTSMSTPLVAGVAALLLEANPEWIGVDVRSALMETADQSENPNNDFGWGIIDAFAASGVQAPMVLLGDVIVNDDESGDSMGNGNGIPEPGERIELTVLLHNDGSIPSGELISSLATDQTGVDILADEAIYSSISPGDTTASQSPFLVDLSPSLSAETSIAFSLVARSMADDTLLADAITITTAEMGLLSGTVSEEGTGMPVGDSTIRLIRLDITPPSSIELTVATDGDFSAWLRAGRYAVQARKEGFVSVDADVVELTDSAIVQLYLAKPAPFFLADSILVVVSRDTALVADVQVSNTGTGTLVMSYHAMTDEETQARDNDRWLFLRTDPEEQYGADLLTVHGRACSSEIALRITSAAPWMPGNGTKLVVGLRADGNSDSGLEAAGIPADYKVEWNNTASLFRAYAGMWRYASSVVAESVNDTLTIRFPRESLLFPSLPILELAIRVENWTDPDTIIILDTVPDDGGTSPISFSLKAASWLSQTGSRVTIPEGQTASFPLSFDTHGLSEGLYRADLILQGRFPGGIQLPTILAVGDATELPEHPVLGTPYPNPVTSSFSVPVMLPCASEITLVLTDLSGRTVQSWPGGNLIPGIPFVLSFEVDLSIPRGAFLLRLETDCGSASSRAIVRD